MSPFTSLLMYCIIARMVDQSIYPKRVTKITDTSATSVTNYSNNVRLPKLHPTYILAISFINISNYVASVTIFLYYIITSP